MDPILQRLDDERALIALTTDYCWALDQRRYEELDQIFTVDATCDYGFVQVAGLDDIKALVAASLGPLDISQHLVSSPQIRIDGDIAELRCNLQAQHTKRGAEGGDNYLIGGYYEDTAVRTGDGWRISHRTLVMTWNEGNRKIIGRT
ncbi:MAG: nuclear transport factor 2 family protein [Acidimicrobiales bacterium]